MKRFWAALVLVVFSAACNPAVLPEFQGVVDVTYPLVDIKGGYYCTATKVAPDVFLTAAHCLDNPMGGLILGKDGQLKTFKILKQDKEVDLALIGSVASGPVVTGILSEELDQYTPIVAAGFPYGVALYITEGRWIGDSQSPQLANHSHTSAPVGPGNSGGGIFTRIAGQWILVAVVQMRATDSAHVSIVSKPSVLKEFLSGKTN